MSSSSRPASPSSEEDITADMFRRKSVSQEPKKTHNAGLQTTMPSTQINDLMAGEAELPALLQEAGMVWYGRVGNIKKPHKFDAQTTCKCV